MKACAKCSRENVQTASMIAKAGKTSTKGVGVGAGGLGLGYAESSSRLAKEAEFKAPSDGLASDSQGCFMIILAAFAAMVPFIALILATEYLNLSKDLGELLGMPLFISALIMGIIIFVKINSYSSSRGAEAEAAVRLEKAKLDYQHTWMCLDCGHKWVAPYKTNPKEPVVKKDNESKDGTSGCLKPIALFLVILFSLTMYFSDRVAWVNVDSLNVRSEPDGEVIRSVKFGTRLVIKETDGEWKRIHDGWVKNEFLSVSDPTVE